MDEILVEIKEHLKHEKYFEDVNWPEDISEKSNYGYIWVGTKNGLIGCLGCHYEFVFGNDGKLYTEVHIDETRCQKLFKNIDKGDLLDFAYWNYSKGKILIRNSGVDVNQTGYVDKAIEQLKFIHKQIGVQLSEIISANQDLFFDDTNYAAPLLKPRLSDGHGSIVTSKHYNEITSRFVGEMETIHGKLQRKLIKTLKANPVYSVVEPEKSFEGLMYHIDVLAQRNNKNCYDVFEVKTNKTAIGCVREALGQILLYKHLLETGEYKVRNIYIIGSETIKEYEKGYFRMLKKMIPNLFYCLPDEKRLIGYTKKK